MIVTAIKGTITPDTMGDLFVQHGYRSADNGTYYSAFRWVADTFNIEYTETYKLDDVVNLLINNHYVVCSVGNGLFTTGGHFIVLVGIEGDTIKVYDPYLYAGKFETSTRRGKVRVDGNTVYCSIDNFRNYANYMKFFAYKHDGNTSTNNQPVVTSTYTRYVKANGGLRVRNNPNGAIVGLLQTGTKVTVYETSSNWSKIGTNEWVCSDYLYTTIQTTPTYNKVETGYNTGKYRVNVSSYLNVRSAPSTNDSIISHLNNNTEVLVDGEQNGWYHITSPTNGWVSGNYLSDGGSSVPNINRGTVGQLKRFAKNTVIYETSNLSGKQWQYLPLTQVKILANINAGVDKVYVVKTGRVGYVNIGVYK